MTERVRCYYTLVRSTELPAGRCPESCWWLKIQSVPGVLHVSDMQDSVTDMQDSGHRLNLQPPAGLRAPACR